MVEPWPAIQDPAERRRARVLTTMIFAIVPLGALSISAQLVLVPGFWPTFVASASALVVLSGLGVLARGRHYRVAAGAATVAVVLACAGAGLGRADDPAWWAYAMIGVLLATLLVSLRAAVLVALLSIGSIVVVGVYHGASADQLVVPLMFQVVYAPLLLVVAHHRNRIEDDRRAELVANQQLLEQAERVARVGHFQVRKDTHEIEVSDSLRELLDLDAEPLDLDQFLSRLESRSAVELLVTGTGPRSGAVDSRWHGPGGRVQHVSVSVESLIEGRVDVVLGTVQDITARVLAEQEHGMLLERALDGQRLETVGRIASGVAHDFNNLLTVITTASSLARDASPAERDGYLIDLDAAAQRGASLVRQLLAYAGKQVMETTELELATVVDEVRPILAHLAGKDVLRVRADQRQPVPVRADRTQLEQILVNLVVNARDELGAGGTIEVRTGAVANGPAGTALEDVACAYLVVTDDGAGIDPEVRRRIFEPFFTTKHERGGTGLGLATVQGIVHQSGGHVEVDSAPGLGTSFRIYLPLLDASGTVPARDGEAPPADPRGHVLVIDDDPAVLRTTTRILELSGRVVIAACGAHQARQRWREHRDDIDVILSDVVMDDTDGVALVGELVADAPDTRVVLMSGVARAPRPGPALAAADLTVVAKPFSRATLMAAIDGRAPAS